MRGDNSSHCHMVCDRCLVIVFHLCLLCSKDNDLALIFNLSICSLPLQVMVHTLVCNRWCQVTSWSTQCTLDL